MKGCPCLVYGFRFIYVADTQFRSVPGSSGRLMLAISATGIAWRSSLLTAHCSLLTAVIWMMKSLWESFCVGEFPSLPAKCREPGMEPMGRWLLQSVAVGCSVA